MSRSLHGAGALVVLICGVSASQAGATDLARCPPHPHRHHVARHVAPQIVYGRYTPRHPAVAYNHEDNGQYDGADVPPPHARQLAYGQQPSWLDGYGTRPITYGAYGTYNVYGGTAQVMPFGLPPGGGLAVYEPGGFGPGPSIIKVPEGY